MADLSVTESLVCDWAKDLMASDLCTKHAFPDKVYADRMAGECIDEAIKDKNLTDDPIARGKQLYQLKF